MPSTTAARCNRRSRLARDAPRTGFEGPARNSVTPLSSRHTNGSRFASRSPCNSLRKQRERFEDFFFILGEVELRCDLSVRGTGAANGMMRRWRYPREIHTRDTAPSNLQIESGTIFPE